MLVSGAKDSIMFVNGVMDPRLMSFIGLKISTKSEFSYMFPGSKAMKGVKVRLLCPLASRI